ncbi:acyl-homoserine lactone acylase PvdQ [Rhabdobacter roseus]|uniref:Acyl-homoserine lactone acylase PvdQ n=1 Tax=Rhabdobacter roseus TaxID=1655419 RepID=A0A840TK56_9BACT|nr:penicillin acylase family protein [Rhabdobacter roseus]MBB5284586.1 acyl-homoserine lactone acylase PvdQ [Rhabdobacter roseus]
MKTFSTLVCLTLLCFRLEAQSFSSQEISALKKQARQVTIVKDKWGIPHVYAKTDAGAVFGMMYVQCEEFFEKVESTLISRLGRQAEVEGEAALYKDLWTRMYIDSSKAIGLYEQSPRWLQKLCDAYADGINFYMISHPEKKPKLIQRVQPWMVLMNNVPALAGSNIDEDEFVKFYGKDARLSLSYRPGYLAEDPREPAGSNGWALSPARTQSKNAMLLINPHSEFYGRIEIQVVSKQGLNAYGAPFLGQFNIFQGFNEYCGWMHPVSLSDAKDLYTEQVEQQDGRYFYRYNGSLRPVDSTRITLQYKKGNELLSKTFTTYRTHHGPVVSAYDKKWITLKTLDDPNIDLLAMHWQKMKARNLKEFKASMDTRVMTGSNVIYADRAGNIGYWHGNFVPQKDPALDWKRAVDGSTDATEWKGTYALDDLPHYLNPANGWLQNCNSTILYGTGTFDSTMYRTKPTYMLPDGQTPRADGAIRVLSQLQNATLDDVIAAAHDKYLAGGERHVPALLAAYAALPSPSTHLAGPIQTLRAWNYQTDTGSVATTLATLWVEKMIPLNLARLQKPYTNEERYSITNGAKLTVDFVTPEKQVETLAQVVAELEKNFGTWQVPWGQLNRFQRPAEGEPFSDDKPSWGLPATPGFMGSLNAYVSRPAPGTHRRYGATGNTFVAVVDFGKKLRGKSILTGGASTDPASPHFTDQVEGYIQGTYKDILFYKKDVLRNAEKTYHPGD